MKVSPEDKCCLEELYLYHAIPTDQLRRNPVALGRIVAAFHRLTGRDDEAPELLRYMINRRKNRDWPCLGENARQFTPALRELLDGELDLLVDAYTVIRIPLDEYLLRDNLPKKLASAFAAAAGRFVKAATLVAALMAHRKRGLLPCLVEEKLAAESRAFADIQIVARAHQRAAVG